jgi:hypothetical protein
MLSSNTLQTNTNNYKKYKHMNNTNNKVLENILNDIEEGYLDVAFHEGMQLHTVVKGNGLDYVGYIITSGKGIKSYSFKFESARTLTAQQLIKAYEKHVAERPVISVQEAFLKLYE